MRIGAVIGFLTLVAAGIAAHFAKRAAIETARGANAAEDAITEGRRVGEATVRAYLTVKDVVLEIAENGVSVECSIANSGQSPANNVHWCARIGYVKYLEPKPRWSGYNAPIHDRNSIPIPSGETEIPLRIWINHLPDDDESYRLSIKEEISIICQVIVNGIDVFNLPITVEDAYIGWLTYSPFGGDNPKMQRFGGIPERTKRKPR